MEKRLYRSTDDRIVSGVCAGFADYMGVDPTLVRLGMVALSFVACGTTVPFYIIAILIIPEKSRFRRDRETEYYSETDKQQAEDLYETSAKPEKKDDETPIL